MILLTETYFTDYDNDTALHTTGKTDLFILTQGSM